MLGKNQDLPVELANIIDSPPGDTPFYVQDSKTFIKSSAIAQGFGSGFDADRVDGLRAVTATKHGPNRLVATGSSGLLPAAIIPPTAATAFQISNRAVTKYYTLWVETDGSLSVDLV